MDTEVSSYQKIRSLSCPDSDDFPVVQIRIKLVGVRVELTEMHAIGTINENFLGPLD